MRLRPFAVPPARALRAWETRRPSFAPGARAPSRHDVDETTVRVHDAHDAFARARDALLAYRVYDERLLVHRIDTPDGRVRPGALILQRARLVGPVAVEAGVRVDELVDEPRRVGFRYVTLAGHPERGAASFWLAWEADRVTFRMESVSEPGLLATRVGARSARALQRRAV